jgi:predicted MPP superfamily phosphohydrolase
MLVLLFALMCLGHLVLLVGCHNWWYGLPLPKGTGKILHLLMAVLFVAFPAVLWSLHGPDLLGYFRWSADSSLGQILTAVYVACCWAAGLVLFPVVSGRRWLRRQAVLRNHSEIVDVAAQLGHCPTGTGKYRFLTWLPGNECFQVELNEKTLAPPRLPREWDGLTILHLSDLHLNGTPDRDYFRYIMDRCAAWNPDLVAITGDIADSWRHQRWIVPILGRLRWQTAAFAILGNHDYFFDPPFIRRRLGRLRMQVLGNTWQVVEVRGRPLVVIGQEWPWLRPSTDLSGCPEEPFRLCLSHTPDNIAWARRARIDLMLSGHVHGGQVRFPGIGSLFVPSRYGRRYDAGTFSEGPTLLHVSRGLSGEQQLRYRCRPEATLLRLRSEP